MEISSHIKITNLNQINSLSSDQIFLVGENFDGYVNKKITVEDLVGHLKNELKRELYDETKEKIESWIVNDISSNFYQKNEELTKNDQDHNIKIENLEAGMTILSNKIDYIVDFTKKLNNSLYDLSVFSCISSTEAILRIANCQSKLRDLVNGLSSNLSVTFI